MSNQNQQITGHRQLSQAEIDDINKLKTLANQVGEFIATLEKSDTGQARAEKSPTNKTQTNSLNWV